MSGLCLFVCWFLFVGVRVPKHSGTHNAVEAVEGGVEVGLFAQAIHLYHHLCQEYPQEDEFSKICRGKKMRSKKEELKHKGCPPIHPSMEGQYFTVQCLHVHEMQNTIL